MKNLYRILCCLALLTMIYSCKKDKNNYNYKVINELNIKTDKDDYVVEQLSILNIKPIITETIGGGPYSYQWSVYKSTDEQSYNISPTNPANIATILSTEKDFNKEISLKAGSYILRFTITDTKTNVSAYKKYPLVVNGKFYEGWTVTANKGSVPEISFIRSDNQVFKNVVTVPLNGKALKSFSAVVSKMESVIIFTDQDIYSFTANSFALESKSADLFRNPVTPINPFYTISVYNTDQYIINDGGVYGTITPNFGDVGKYSERFNLPGSNYSVFPYYLFGSNYYTIFYDNLGKRFLQTSYNIRSLSPFPNFPNAPYDLNNVGKTAISIDLGSNDDFNCIMKDASNYYLYVINGDQASAAVKMQAIANSPDLAQAVAFTSSQTVKQLYYGAGNKIYLYDLLANSSRLVYQFPTGTNVKDLKILKANGYQNTTNDLYNKRIVAATYNGGEGEVYYFDLSSTGDIKNNTYSNKFGGFGDIAQINYRNPNE